MVAHEILLLLVSVSMVNSGSVWKMLAKLVSGNTMCYLRIQAAFGRCWQNWFPETECVTYEFRRLLAGW